jgi:hypothetical protein
MNRKLAAGYFTSYTLKSALMFEKVAFDERQHAPMSAMQPMKKVLGGWRQRNTI